MINRTFDIQDVERVNRTIYLFEDGNEAEVTYRDQHGRMRTERYIRQEGHQFRLVEAIRANGRS